MKKLMIALAAVAMAACAQATQVKWGSGMLYSPDSDGSIGASWTGKAWIFTQTAITDKGTVSAVIWEATTAFTELAAGKLYEAYVNKTTASTFKDATVYTGNNGTAAAVATVNGGSTYSSGDKVYSAVLYVLQEEGKDAWYMENYSTAATIGNSATTWNNLAQFEGGGKGVESSTPMSWTAVPEPTSGLLLLLGVAGLALRRKQK